MQLHTLRAKTNKRRGQRIGRGGKRGTTAGRGTKGQKARAGHKIRPEIRDTLKRIPKLRGFKFRSFQEKPAVVSLAALEAHFESGATVTVPELIKKGLVLKRQGSLPRVKILGEGALLKNLSVIGMGASKSARAAIVKAGGNIR